jgi:Kef-type K+ transport system membrane component KefB
MLLNISFHFDYFPLMVVMAVAWFTPMLLSWINMRRIPSVIVEIILGFIIARYFVEFDGTSLEILRFLALSGFVFLMFLSGLEIDIDQMIASLPRKIPGISSYLSNPLLIGISHFILALILSYIAAWLLSGMTDIGNVWYFSLIMVTTSVGIILPVLKNRGEIHSRFGQMLIIAAAVADIFSILLFTFTASILKNGFHWDLLLIVALFFVFYLFYFIGGKLKHIPVLKRITYQLSHAASQINMRSILLLILIFVVIAQYIGEEVILLGAFLSGLLLSAFMHRERSLVMIKLDGMGYGFFIPVFFIMVGYEFDPTAFSEFEDSLFIFLITLLVVLFLIKLIPSLLWTRFFGMRKAVSGGFLMSSRLSLIIAASAIGLQLGVISPGINASFVMMAVATCLLSPTLFNTLSPVKRLEGSKTIIIGGSSTAVLLSRRMHLHGKQVVIVEKDEKRYREIVDKGLWVKKGDGLDRELYNKLKLKPDNYVVVECGSDKTNMAVSKLLRKEFLHEKVITRSGSLKVELQLKRVGVEAVDARRVMATTIENLIVRPTTYHDLVESFENFSLDEIIVEKKEMDGRQVKTIPFHKDAILMIIKRGNESYIPHGETYLRKGDILHVFGTATALEDTRKKVGE